MGISDVISLVQLGAVKQVTVSKWQASRAQYGQLRDALAANTSIDSIQFDGDIVGDELQHSIPISLVLHVLRHQQSIREIKFTNGTMPLVLCGDIATALIKRKETLRSLVIREFNVQLGIVPLLTVLPSLNLT